MQGTKVIFGTYNSMPHGISSRIFERTYQNSWRPFLSGLYKFPTIHAVLYYSGTVLQWIEENHPEFMLLLEEMLGKKQIELLGGPYFDPLYPVIQPGDRLGQIEMLTTYLRKAFGKRPSGTWIPEYSWDASLPSVFRNSGLSYSFLPLKLLDTENVDSDTVFKPRITEDQHKLFYIFPVVDIEEDLETIASFEDIVQNQFSSNPNLPLISVMLRGSAIPRMWEVSGLASPDVLFEKTFAWFQKNCLIFETITAQSYMKQVRSGSLFYLSLCASSRMINKIASPIKQNSYCNANPVRKLIMQNPYSKRLFDKMYYMHAIMNLLRGDKTRKKVAMEELWKGQNGNAYWEGDFGGIKRPEIRARAYHALIHAEKATRAHGSFSPGLVFDDIDCDGESEAAYQANDYNCYVSNKGAAVFELDSLKSKHNYCCTYSSNMLIPPECLRDKFYAPGSFLDEQLDMSKLQYSLIEADKNINRVVFCKEISLRQGDSIHPLFLRKNYLFQKHVISVDYEIINRSTTAIQFRFGPEIRFQLALDMRDLEFFRYESHDRIPIPAEAESLEFQSIAFLSYNNSFKENLELRSPKNTWFSIFHSIEELPPSDEYNTFAMMPYTEAQSDFQAVHERIYQGTVIKTGWDAILPPDSASQFSLSIHLHT